MIYIKYLNLIYYSSIGHIKRNIFLWSACLIHFIRHIIDDISSNYIIKKHSKCLIIHVGKKNMMNSNYFDFSLRNIKDEKCAWIHVRIFIVFFVFLFLLWYHDYTCNFNMMQVLIKIHRMKINKQVVESMNMKV